jgi:hypothetical protein
MQVGAIGIDLAKNLFQVHGIDAAGGVVITKKLRRSQMLPLFATLPPCLIEAWQERRGRCSCHLRGGEATEHALCADQERRATGGIDVAPGTGSSDPPTHTAD